MCNDKVVTLHSVTRPWAYVLRGDQQEVIANLRHHGIQMEVLIEGDNYHAEAYKVESYSKSKRKYEGHLPAAIKVEVDGEYKPGAAPSWEVVEGDIVIRTAQPLGSLAAFLLEPESEDGLCYWNYFDDDLEHGWGLYPVFRVMTPQDWKTKPLVD